MVQKVFKTGNSLAVTIPAKFASLIGIRSGQSVLVRQELEKSRLIFQFPGSQQLPLDTSFFGKKDTKRKGGKV